jgi:signal transduction histidine kinase
MEQISQQVFDLITTNPGNLIYHLILAFSIMGALQAALHIWRSEEFPQGRRMVIGLSLLLGTRLVLLSIAAWGYFSSADAHLWLPVADRAMMTFALILILWLWIFPEPSRGADTASTLLAFLILCIFLLNQVWWGSHYTEGAFNLQIVSVGWEILAMLILIAGSILLLIRRPNGTRYGLFMMAVLAFGHIGQMLYSDTTSDYPGIVRFFELAAFPLLWALPNRFNLPISVSQRPAAEPVVRASVEKRRYGINPETFQTILSLPSIPVSETGYQRITKLLAETFFADICMVILPPNDTGQITIPSGYDLIREIYLQPVAFSNDRIPLLVSAMNHMRPLRLPASSTSVDLVSLGQYLEIGRTGHLLAAFVPPAQGNQPIMGFILISPYTDRRWSREDQAFLNKIATTIALNMRQSNQLDKSRKELEITQQNLKSFQNLLAETQAENEGLRNELSTISRQALQGFEKETESLANQQKESQNIIRQLQSEKSRLQEMLQSYDARQDIKTGNTSQLEEELKLALTEISQLNNQLLGAEPKFKQAQDPTTSSEGLPVDQAEVITSVAQDLRQPMSSIIGYTELLLGESVGILGALQRKFLERIKASTERMDTLLDDLFQVVTLDSEGLTLRLEPLKLSDVIDEALADTRHAIKERGIVLALDFPDQMPELVADRDALEQILIQLIKNAETATPENGQVKLRVSTYQADTNQKYILIEITDQGGGIPNEDLPRVFSRLYRADNPLIPGIGDTGVGLSIAKSLVEAHNGRIWVDTEPGKGSSFSLLIPLTNNNLSSLNTTTAGLGEKSQ